MRIDTLSLTFRLRRNRENSAGVSPVVVRLSIDERRVELATGFFCPPAYWRNSLQKLALPADEAQRLLPDYGAVAVGEINEELYQLQRTIAEAYKRLRKPDLRGPVVAVRLGDLKEALRGPQKTKQERERERATATLLALYEAFLAERAGLIGVEIAAATDLSHRTRYNRLTDYLQAHGLAGLRPESFGLNHADKLLHWLMKERNFKRNTGNKVLRGVSQVLGWAVRRELLAKNPMEHYEYRHQQVGPIKFLTVGELETISCAELASNSLGQVRDCFVFQCWTGLAYADLCALNVARDAEYHRDRAGNVRRVLRITRAKSTMYKGYECVIPLLPEAERLLAHYGDALPVLTNQAYNRGLKELGQLCGIRAEKMTTHVGRKTAGTLLLNMGVALPVVSKFLGHANVLITQKLYAELLDTTVIDAFAVLGGYAAPAAEAQYLILEHPQPVGADASAVGGGRPAPTMEANRWRWVPPVTSHDAPGQPDTCALATWGQPASRKEVAACG